MVSMDKVESLIFCEGLAKEYLERLVSLGKVRHFAAGTYLFHEGQHGEHVFLLGEGLVGLEVSLPGHGPQRVQTVGPGELIGWSPLLGLGWMTASAVALAPCRVLALEASRVRELIDEGPRFGVELMRWLAVTLARRLNATRMQMLEEHCNEDQVVS
jgi:CRP-like cAMP-binding protein